MGRQHVSVETQIAHAYSEGASICQLCMDFQMRSDDILEAIGSRGVALRIEDTYTVSEEDSAWLD